MKTGRLIVVVLALASGGAKDCESQKRGAGVARAEAVRLLRSPVLCEGSLDDGHICVDNRGGMVTCPVDLSAPCKLVAGRPEASAP